MQRPLTVIVPAKSYDSSIGGPTPRKAELVDKFAAELEKAAGSPVPVFEGPLDQAPAEGLLIVFDGEELARHPELGPRTLLINPERSELWNPNPETQVCSRYRLVGAVESLSYWEWKTSAFGGYIFGKKSVGVAAGLRPMDMPLSSEYDGLFANAQCRDLPSLIVLYLTAYEQFLAGTAGA